MKNGKSKLNHPYSDKILARAEHDRRRMPRTAFGGLTAGMGGLNVHQGLKAYKSGDRAFGATQAGLGALGMAAGGLLAHQTHTAKKKMGNKSDKELRRMGGIKKKAELDKFAHLKIAISAKNGITAGSALLRGGQGALLGAAGNAARQAYKNKKDPSKKKSLLGAAAKGGAAGAAVGGVAGAIRGRHAYNKHPEFAEAIWEQSQRRHNR